MGTGLSRPWQSKRRIEDASLNPVYAITSNADRSSFPSTVKFPQSHESQDPYFRHRFTSVVRPYVTVTRVRVDAIDPASDRHRSITRSTYFKNDIHQTISHQLTDQQRSCYMPDNSVEQSHGIRGLNPSDSYIHRNSNIRVSQSNNVITNEDINRSSLGAKSYGTLDHWSKNSSVSRKCNAYSDPSISFNSGRSMTDVDWTSTPFKYRRAQPPNKKKQKKPTGLCYCCSPVCICVATLVTLLLAITLAAVLAALLVKRASSVSTTTVENCGATCVNQSWIQSTGLLAKWSFDGDYVDKQHTYNATPIDSPSFTSKCYSNQALFLNASANQSLTAPYIPLYMSSFTVEAWLYPIGFPNTLDHSIVGLCPVAATQNCLFLTIRKMNGNRYFYFGFYSTNDLASTTPVKNVQWVHVAFVFDQNTLEQSIYINGYLDARSTALAPLLAATGTFEIGHVMNIESTYGSNYFRGYIDELTISNRVKPSCEILDDASYIAYFKFDSGSPLIDSGPNSLIGTANSTSIVPSHTDQSLSFNGSAYFQVENVGCLFFSNLAFSIALWIQPNFLSGPLVHVSSNQWGTGSCVTHIGFDINGNLAAQILYFGPKFVVAPSSIALSPSWTHIVQTWSPANGLRLYVNKVLVASNATVTSGRSGSDAPVFLTLANTLNDTSYCYNSVMDTLNPFSGAIDDLRVYCRELSDTDICTIYDS